MIGLLSIHASQNYGASLQAFALYSAIKELEYDVELINYHYAPFCSILDKSRRKDLIKPLNLLRLLVMTRRIIIKHIRFNQFNKRYTCITSPIYKKNDLKKYGDKYTAVICGSDQIWNPENIQYDSSYFLDFVNDTCKRISYAASIGQSEISSKAIDFINKYINQIDYISVREPSAKDILLSIGVKKNIEINIDPVFLLDKQRWIENGSNIHLKGKYILLYTVANNPETLKVLENVKRQTGLPCYCINSKFKGIRGVDKKFTACGPEQFLYILHNADAIVTDSFHGVAFSIIFNKRFVAISNLRKNTRIENLLQIFNMQQCFSQNCGMKLLDMDYFQSKYNKASVIIKNQKTQAYKYIKESIDSFDSVLTM